jgi:phospholipid/cholesterol/gamma-HCH transport system permease protein
VSTAYLDIDPGTFMSGVRDYLDPNDITQGLLKAVVFGLLMALVSCHKGYYATGGSRGVAAATTEAVVVASVLILVSDYLMTTLMFRAA